MAIITDPVSLVAWTPSPLVATVMPSTFLSRWSAEQRYWYRARLVGVAVPVGFAQPDNAVFLPVDSPAFAWVMG
jgi:hypothetical protein